MYRASLPILMNATPAARKLLGQDLPRFAVLAVQAILRHRRGIEVAHQQVRFRKACIAFSSRIGREGDLILDLDVGNPALGERVVMEIDLRKAEREHVANAAREQPPRRPRW
jgi:hypothetical protein